MPTSWRRSCAPSCVGLRALRLQAARSPQRADNSVTNWMTFESILTRRSMRAQAQIACVALIGAVASIVVAPDLRGVLGALLALVMLAIALTDARYCIIPDEWNAAGLTLALLNAVLQNPDTIVEAMAVAVLRGGVLALLFLGLRVGYRSLRGRE